MALTDAKARTAKPAEKTYRLADANGMYLEIAPSGAKYWRLKYRFAGKEKRLALGTYPTVSLAVARRTRDEARMQLADGIDPGETRKAQKRTARLNAENCFEAVAREWHARYADNWTDGYAEKVLRRLTLYAFPWIGGRPIAELEAAEVLDALRRVEKQRKLETAHRLRVNIGQVMRYAVATARAKRDVTVDLRGALAPIQTKHFAAITDPAELGHLLNAIDGYTGTFPVSCALKLSPLLFQRPGELRQAEWTEFDLESATWEVPSVRMKRVKAAKLSGAAHIVPLSTQAVTILRDLHALTGAGQYLFPSARSNSRPMSDNALNAALRRLGYGNEMMTGHGFRATARTILDEVLGVPIVIIEAQLAHCVRDPLGRAYNRTSHLPQRREMMQHWADYLHSLRYPNSTHEIR
ncbi:tyrosine-type recombinase/integrase [Pandoraea commovens]|uniref:Integrase n=1 Tax=Pandoraea commovens TaxID=2508289 RepID=A0A5E4YXZ8_9BURK|nr:integrase arm-type DNA-binding domain-containing protein [Pandoraea commovens]VVE53372.1 integrase [Pandoraea commovens]